MHLGRKKGIAMLFAILILSVILAVALTLISVIVKQLKISSANQNSVVAVYAADTGIECALLWDVRGYEAGFFGYPVFPTSTAGWTDANSPTPSANSNLDCDGEDITAGWTDGGASPTIVHEATAATTTFELGLPGNACAKIQVAKYPDATNPDKTRTSILSRGYNVDCAETDTNLTAVERAIKVRYIFN